MPKPLTVQEAYEHIKRVGLFRTSIAINVARIVNVPKPYVRGLLRAAGREYLMVTR